MKTYNILLRIALLVFLTLSIAACTQSNHSQMGNVESANPAPSKTPSPKPSNTPLPTPTLITDPAAWHNIAFPGTQVYQLAMDPVDPHILYAAVIQNDEDQLLKSKDRGESWEPLLQDPVLPKEFKYQALVINPQQPDILYVAVKYRGIFKSEDGGDSWETINDGLKDFNFSSLTIHPNQMNTIYSVSEHGIFKTTDGGAHWQFLHEPVTEYKIYSLAINPWNPSEIYLCTMDGLYRSTDDCKTWQFRSKDIQYLVPETRKYVSAWVYTITFDPYDPEIMYLGGYGASISINGGNTWESASEGLDFFGSSIISDVNFLTIDPNHPGTIYAVDEGYTVFRTEDNTNTWNHFDPGLNDDYLRPRTQVVIDYTNSNILYIGTNEDGLYSTRPGTSPQQP